MGFNRGVDIDVVALQLAVVALELHTQPSQRPAKTLGIGRSEGRELRNRG